VRLASLNDEVVGLFLRRHVALGDLGLVRRLVVAS
jgi:hypothetical protein